MRGGYDLSDTRMYLVPVGGGLPEPLPMPESGACDLSPDGTQVVYSPLARDFRTWKRYEGGWAQELYVFDLETHELSRVTDHRRTDRDPMWIGDTICFSSDRDGKNNLYAFDTGSGETRQLTRQLVWDVRWPSDDGHGRIVYELGGRLVVYTPVDRPLPADLDRGPGRRSLEAAFARLGERPRRGLRAEPEGRARALRRARGRVHGAHREGPTRNLTGTSNAHEKWARWSPDGRQIAYVSDATGEDEVYLVDQDGRGDPEQLTSDGAVMRNAVSWSPDGTRLAYGDKSGRLFVVDVESRDETLVADEARGMITDYTWSACGGHLAFTLSEENGYGSIHVWSVADGTLRKVTGELFNDFNPAWDPGGDYLYYFADRAYAPQISSIEWNFATDRETYLYALALREDVAHPFPPESDEVDVEEEEDDDDEEEEAEGDDEEEGEGEDEEESYVEIDFDGLGQRVARVPVEADNYSGLSAVEGHVLYVRGGPFYYGRGSTWTPRSRCSPSRTARRRPSPRTSRATRSRATARRCWSAGEAASSCTTRGPPARAPASPCRRRA